jgi:hypothetical protein
MKKNLPLLLLSPSFAQVRAADNLHGSWTPLRFLIAQKLRTSDTLMHESWLVLHVAGLRGLRWGAPSI